MGPEHTSVGGLISRLTSTLFHRANTPRLPEFDSFEGALRASDSYEDPRLIDVVFEKTRIYRQQLLDTDLPVINSRQLTQNLFVLSYLHYSRNISVLEIGGACGAGYFEIRQLLPDRIAQWSIAETPAMAAASSKLNNDPSLSSHADLHSAVSVLNTRDVAIAQGVLQYARDPLQLLNDLFMLGFDYVYISRTVVLVGDATLKSQIFTQQNTQLSSHGPGTLPPGFADGPSSQPMVLVNRDAVWAAIPADYELMFIFEESEKRTSRIGDRELQLGDVGFLAKRRG